jgi:hypothetical protein
MATERLDEVTWQAGGGSDRKWPCGPKRGPERDDPCVRACPDVIGQQFELARTEFFSS